MQGLEGASVAVLVDPEPSPLEPGELSYLDIWCEWLENRPDGRVTVRKAQQTCPRSVRTNSEGIKQVFRQLQLMDMGLFDEDTLEFQWVGE
jgi:hypothetical protein